MKPFTFAFLTDPQIGMNSPNGLEGEGSDKSRLDIAVDYINEKEFEFLIFGGDQVNRGFSESEIDVFMASTERIKIPWYGVSGNHDQEERYMSIEETPKRFSFFQNDCFFMGFNATELRGDAEKLTEGLQAKEWAYLRESFTPEADDAKFRFVFMHWPLFINHPEEDGSYWNMPNRLELLEFFKEKKVSCVFSGHYHQDIDIDWQGIRLISSTSTSGPLHYPEQPAFKIITVFEDGYSVRRISAEKPEFDPR
ncbi:MAG: metallophosphoesterase [Lentisphaeria bacterium]|nr:metallophosphoesterase [Lentisphaeria bacterium]NQZ68183.1 metallophosphoesterase [Lentisphaeria bacterium]